MTADLMLQGLIYEHNYKSSLHIVKTESGDTLQSKRLLIETLISKGIYGYLFSKLFKRSIIEDNNIRFNTNSHFIEDEEFFSKYLLYVKSWRSSDKAAYHYFLPDGAKTYKGNRYQSLIPIFKYLDTIFDGQYPSAISNIHTRNIKDMITLKCCTNQPLSEYECDLYRRLKQTQLLSPDRPIVSKLIINSHKNALIRFTIGVLHNLKARFNRK